MPPGPALFDAAEPHVAPSMPPLPPPEFQQAADPNPTPPRLPGDEHRVDATEADQPSMPPLPPDSMRTAD